MNQRQFLGLLQTQSHAQNATNQWRKMEDAIMYIVYVDNHFVGCAGATGLNHTWNSIEGHTCGRYKAEDVKNMEATKDALWRYVHYHERYKGHTESLKAEIKLKVTGKGVEAGRKNPNMERL